MKDSGTRSCFIFDFFSDSFFYSLAGGTNQQVKWARIKREKTSRKIGNFRKYLSTNFKPKFEVITKILGYLRVVQEGYNPSYKIIFEIL